MNFDPALTAQDALKRSLAAHELGPDEDAATEAEDTFSSSAGPDASEAYHRLLELGQRHPQAAAFHEFLIFITWQQLTECTIARYFQIGLDLSNHYLATHAQRTTAEQRERVEALRESYVAGLGQTDEPLIDFDKDIVKGGD
jgi:hypothetical protein